MRSSKIALAALAGLVATAASGNAVSVPNGAAIQPISDAALEQILETSQIQMALVRKPWVQEAWPQGWRTEVKTPKPPKPLTLSSLPAPSGDVAAVFGSLKIS